MLNWMKRRGMAAYWQREARAAPPNTPKVPGRVMAGRYLLLYQYLENRYANTVVLTFAQIEDLLGFTLPDSARVHQEWWTNKDPNDTPPSHSRSWILASRTATPNLRAQTVVFERAQH